MSNAGTGFDHGLTRDMSPGASARNAEAALATEQMTLLRRLATVLSTDEHAELEFHPALIKLMHSNACAAPGFVVNILNGEHGNYAAHFAWRAAVARGIRVKAQGKYAAGTVSVAWFCASHDHMRLLRAIALHCDLTAMPSELRPANRSRLLDLLCTIESGRNNFSFKGFDGCHGLVGLAATHSNPSFSTNDALELAWEVNPMHDGFVALAKEASAAGAVVRAFLMNKDITVADSAASTSLAPADAVGNPTAKSLRRRRVGL